MIDRATLYGLAERQHGLVTPRQCRELGLSRQNVHDLLATGEWRRAGSQVMRRAGAPRTEAQVLLTPVLDVGSAAISHLTAAAWWGQTGCSLVPINLVTTIATTRTIPGARVRRVRELPPGWVTELRGVPVVRPELLAIQLFADCSEGRANALVDRLWSQRLLCGRSIAAVLGQMGARGRNGIAGLRRYLDARGGDYVPPASNLESRAMQLFAEAGVPMRRQVDSGGERWTGRVDFRHERRPLIVEIQSEAHHTALVDREADERRIGQLRDDGFVVIEITDTDVWTRPGLVVRDVTAAERSVMCPSSVAGRTDHRTG